MIGYILNEISNGVNKIKIVLKELRETFICLKIVYRAKLCKSEDKIQSALQENNELISIFVKSIETAQKNSKKPTSS